MYEETIFCMQKRHSAVVFQTDLSFSLDSFYHIHTFLLCSGIMNDFKRLYFWLKRLSTEF